MPKQQAKQMYMVCAQSQLAPLTAPQLCYGDNGVYIPHDAVHRETMQSTTPRGTQTKKKKGQMAHTQHTRQTQLRYIYMYGRRRRAHKNAQTHGDPFSVTPATTAASQSVSETKSGATLHDQHTHPPNHQVTPAVPPAQQPHQVTTHTQPRQTS